MGTLRVAALLALILPAIPAVAKQPPVRVLSDQAAVSADCGPIRDVLHVFHKRYGEALLWFGQAEGDVTMLITQRPDAKTWTLLALHDGLACIVSIGGTRNGVGS